MSNSSNNNANTGEIVATRVPTDTDTDMAVSLDAVTSPTTTSHPLIDTLHTSGEFPAQDVSVDHQPGDDTDGAGENNSNTPLALPTPSVRVTDVPIQPAAIVTDVPSTCKVATPDEDRASDLRMEREWRNRALEIARRPRPTDDKNVEKALRTVGIANNANICWVIAPIRLILLGNSIRAFIWSHSYEQILVCNPTEGTWRTLLHSVIVLRCFIFMLLESLGKRPKIVDESNPDFLPWIDLIRHRGGLMHLDNEGSMADADHYLVNLIEALRELGFAEAGPEFLIRKSWSIPSEHSPNCKDKLKTETTNEVRHMRLTLDGSDNDIGKMIYNGHQERSEARGCLSCKKGDCPKCGSVDPNCTTCDEISRTFYNTEERLRLPICIHSEHEVFTDSPRTLLISLDRGPGGVPPITSTPVIAIRSARRGIRLYALTAFVRYHSENMHYDVVIFDESNSILVDDDSVKGKKITSQQMLNSSMSSGKSKPFWAVTLLYERVSDTIGFHMHPYDPNYPFNRPIQRYSGEISENRRARALIEHLSKKPKATEKFNILWFPERTVK